MNGIVKVYKEFIAKLTLPDFKIGDFLEILIIAFAIYNVIIWIKKTRAWTLVKGLIVLALLWIAAFIFNLTVIQWLFVKGINVGITAIIIIFQPEFRKALEQLGQNNIVTPLFSLNENKDKENQLRIEAANAILKATFELAKVKTGALIVIERENSLADYEKTGIQIDSLISSQLLINIFEHNTPLHDGAVIIKENRIAAAACILPLTKNDLLIHGLGTRHRAATGISEVTDSLTIVVSEETGKVSIASNGILVRNVDSDYLKGKLLVSKDGQSTNKKLKLWKGREKNERKMD